LSVVYHCPTLSSIEGYKQRTSLSVVYHCPTLSSLVILLLTVLIISWKLSKLIQNLLWPPSWKCCHNINWTINLFLVRLAFGPKGNFKTFRIFLWF